MKKNTACPTVLMYSSHERAFNDGLIGYLYDIAQEWPVFLLSENLAPKTIELLNNKQLFPNLKKIIPVNQYSPSPERTFLSELNKTRHLRRTAENAIKEYSPDILVMETDMSPGFEIYLARYAKMRNILTVLINPWIYLYPLEKASRIVDLENAYKHLRFALPFKLKLLIVRMRKYLGHFLYYWAYPVCLFERPFIGRSSMLLYKGENGMRGADNIIVCSEKVKAVLVEEGVPPQKICVFSHPLERTARKIYEAAGWVSAKKEPRENKNLLLLWPVFEIDAQIGDFERIKKEKMEQRTEDIKTIARSLPGWKILVKPHPILTDISGLKKRLENISGNIEVIHPGKSIIKYLDNADAVIELSGGSAAMYLALLIDRKKPLLSLNLRDEYFGKYYKDIEGIEYVENRARLAELLGSINGGTYQKPVAESRPTDEFPGTIQLFQHLLKKKS